MRSAAVPLPPEVRALTVLDTVPAGCRAMPVPDDRNAPHLRRGEVAIIDPADCVLVHGELFVVQYGRGPAIMQVAWKLWLGGWNWWAVCLNRPRDEAEMWAWARARRSIPSSDGPYRDGGLESITLGRVVGILQPATVQVPHG